MSIFSCIATLIKSQAGYFLQPRQLLFLDRL
jgi:hypothetical protein